MALWVLAQLAELWRSVLLVFGFDVRGWARSSRQIADVTVFAGDKGLASFLDGLDILVSVLPLTPATRGIMNSDMFNQQLAGAYHQWRSRSAIG